MKTRKTRLLYVPAAAALLAALTLAAPQPSTGQEISEADLEALTEALTLQTAQLVNNQATLDAKIDHIGEMVRQARIYAARGGAGARK